MIYATDIIALVNEIRPNGISSDTKKGWLVRCDHEIYENIVLRHADEDEMRPYENETRQQGDQAEPMMIDDPWGTPVYEFYLISMIDHTNGDTARYNNDSIMYNSALTEFAKWYNRKHMPNAAPRFRV